MFRFKRSFLLAAAVVPLFCLSAFGQAVRASGGSSGGVAVSAAPSRGGGNAIAAYVFGEENSNNAEELAEAVVNNLVRSARYSAPRDGARHFFRRVDREQARNRRQMLSDRDFCRIGGEAGVQFLTIIDVERTGRGNSVYARIIDLNNCQVVGSAEFVGLINNTTQISRAANELSAELQHRRINIRGRGAPPPPQPAPPPPPPARRGNQIAAYVFGMDNVALGEELSEAIVNGLANSRTYSQPRRGARGFFQAADRVQARNRSALLSDHDFCRVGTDYEIEYLVIIDIERRGRGASTWARILDLENCQIIATSEVTALVTTQNQIQNVADQIVSGLLRRSVGRRSGR